MTVQNTQEGSLDCNLSIDIDAPWRQVSRNHYDAESSESLTTAIISAIADASAVSPTTLRSPPLYETIDLPALEKIFFGVGDSASVQASVGALAFRYADHLVELQSDGWIRVYESTAPDASNP